MKAYKSKRPCPPSGREITAAECGANRNDRFVCPAECSFNPFAVANYERLLEIESKLDAASLEWLGGRAADPAQFKRELARLISQDNPAATHAFVVTRLFHHRDAAGLSVADHWQQAGFPGLNNDERALFRAKCGLRVALLEVHRVLDHERVEAVDLLAPEAGPLVLLDRALAAMAVRFTTLLGWRYALPHFHRFSGTAFSVQEIAGLPPLEVLQETAKHLGGPPSPSGLIPWLAEHFTDVQASVSATAAARQQDMLAGIDARYGKAVYALSRPFRDCLDRLDGEPALDDSDLSDQEMDEGFAEARDWFEEPPIGDRPVKLLGRVLLGQAHWRLEATGGARFARLRERFEARMGDTVKFTGERLDDLAQQLAKPLPAAQLALVPARLRENPTVIELSTTRINQAGRSGREIESDARQQHLQQFADQPVPALDGQTPRQAALDPALRPRLVQLLKGHVRQFDEEHLRRGTTGDINWLLHELGAHELIFPPPPVRAPAHGPEDDFPEPDEDYGFDDGPAFPPRPPRALGRPPAPPLPAEPLSPEESQRRVVAAMDAFETAAAALDELAVSGATVLEDLSEIIGDLLTEEEFGFLIPLLLPAWFGLVPVGTAAPELDYDRLEAAFDREMDRVDTMLRQRSQRAMEQLLTHCPQPQYVLLLMTHLLDAANTAPKKFRPSVASQPVMLAALFAVIGELDHALRP